ncbi:L,D-transpeptidase family protein [Peribacillus asahii]|uniref:L,D-transpeptidase family protein n=1 Tax=Peribacillus asahii TaxID=228899 RepID=UPI003801DFDE
MKKILVFLLLFASCFVFNSKSTEAAANQFIIINKSTNQLAYYENKKLVSVFPVGTGKKDSYTPEGTFKVVNKIVNRPYYKGNIKGGDPKNPLGTRWLGINAKETQGDTYGIHGNNNPSSIGKYVSAGCVRMYNEDVKWLYSKVKINTPVIIVSSKKSFQSIAAEKGFQVDKSETVTSTINTDSVLKKGSEGPQVKEVQKKLTAKGYDTKGVDGVFGINTEKAVKQFQKENGLTSDGVVGPKTKKLLGIQ